MLINRPDFLSIMRSIWLFLCEFWRNEALMGVWKLLTIICMLEHLSLQHKLSIFDEKKSFMLKFVIYSLRWNCLSAPLRILSSVPFSFSRVSPPHSRLQLRLLPPFGDGVRNLLNGFLMWRQNYFIPFRQYYGQPGKVSIHFFFS